MSFISSTERRDRRINAKRQRERWLRSRATLRTFERALRSVAQQVGALVHGYAPDGVPRDAARLDLALRQYSELLKPWSRVVAEQMIQAIDERDLRAWRQVAGELGSGIAQELNRAHGVGAAVQARQAEVVELITSIPLKAGERVHKLTREMLTESTRASALAKEIARTTQVTKSRAMLIARTEVSRTASLLTQVRAENVGSTHYRWRTLEDSDVRPLHKHLDGSIFAWSTPPVAGEAGERAHPGEIYNCRCWAEPILPD